VTLASSIRRVDGAFNAAPRAEGGFDATFACAGERLASLFMSPDEVKRRVVRYYAATTEQSLLPNWGGTSLGFHFGLGDENTASLADSIADTNRYLAERATVGANTRVLDAGCGVGGSAIWLARERGASVVGITLVERQVELARAFAREQGVEALASFEVLDMTATGYPGQSFDVVWNVESMCHVPDLDSYLAHVAELLADDGRFACIDLCTGVEPDPEVERTVCDGWAMTALRVPGDIAAALDRLGFEDIEVVDLTARAERSAQALEGMASRSLLALRAEVAFCGRAADPIYEGHLRAAIAMASGMRMGKTSLVHVLARRPARTA
jgi:tocopherol O-methyltransferase